MQIQASECIMIHLQGVQRNGKVIKRLNKNKNNTNTNSIKDKIDNEK